MSHRSEFEEHYLLREVVPLRSSFRGRINLVSEPIEVQKAVGRPHCHHQYDPTYLTAQHYLSNLN